MQRFDALFAQHQKWQAVADVVGIGHTPFFQVRAGRQHVVGGAGGFGHKKIVHHQKVEFFKGGFESIAVGHGYQRIAANDHKGLELLRDAFRNNGHHAVGCLAAPELDKQRILITAQRHAFYTVARMPEPRRRTCHPPAGHVDVARNGLQNGKGSAVLGAVGGLILGAGTLKDAGPFGIGKQSRHISNIFGRNPGQLRCPFGRVLLHMGDQPVESGGVVFHKFMVIEIFFNDHVYHGQGQGAVRTGSDAQVHVGLIGHGDPLGIDHHQFGPFFEVLFHKKFERKIRLVGVVPPEDIEVGIRFLGGIAAEGHLPGSDAHAVANAFHRKKVGGSESRAQQVNQGRHLQVFHTDGTAEETKDLGAVFVFQPDQFFSNLVQGLIPADFFEVAIAAHERLFQTVEAVNNIQGLGAFGA